MVLPQPGFRWPDAEMMVIQLVLRVVFSLLFRIISDGTIVRSRNSCINDPIRSTSSFKREMARVEKMELCSGNISLIEFSTLHRKDSIVFAPSDQHGGLLFTEILLPIGIDIQIPFWAVEDS